MSQRSVQCRANRFLPRGLAAKLLATLSVAALLTTLAPAARAQCEMSPANPNNSKIVHELECCVHPLPDLNKPPPGPAGSSWTVGMLLNSYPFNDPETKISLWAVYTDDVTKVLTVAPASAVPARMPASAWVPGFDPKVLLSGGPPEFPNDANVKTIRFAFKDRGGAVGVICKQPAEKKTIILTPLQFAFSLVGAAMAGMVLVFVARLVAARNRPRPPEARQ